MLVESLEDRSLLSVTGPLPLLATSLAASSAPAATFAAASPADLTVRSTHSGTFNQGQSGATYTLTVTNVGRGSTTGTVTLKDILPAGLTATAISGNGWTTNLSTLTATRTDVLARGASYPPLTLTVNVAPNAPTSVTNKAQVSGGGETITTNDNASDPTYVNPRPDLTIASTHTGDFTPGQTGATYTITVTNSGSATATGTVTVTDLLPAGLTATAIRGTGWTTNLATLTATRSTSLAKGASFPPLVVTVNVANNAPASVVNTVKVSGGGEYYTANDTATDPTNVRQVADLTVTSSHVGNFSQGQSGATYTLTVTNSGVGATSGTVTLADILPAGLTATALSGAGWTTNLSTLTATRSDVLAAGASYAPLTVTVNVAANAPTSVVNRAQVSGGGETNTTNDTFDDTTTITPVVSGVQLLDGQLSVQRTKDGQTFTVRYQISSGATTTVQLGCTLVGPSGEVVDDATPQISTTVVAGSAWYTRSFTVNLPPSATLGAYDVIWKMHSDAAGDASLTRNDFLTLDPTVEVRVPVLMYHNISDIVNDFDTVTPAEFRSQMLVLKAYGYTAVTTQDVLDYRAGIKTPPAKPFMLTFDDGFESAITIVLPIISDPAINFRATMFIDTADVRPESVPGGYFSDPMSWSEIRTLAASGYWDIQSHTVSHSDLTTLDPVALAAEMTNSKNLIEQQLNLGKQPTDPQTRLITIAYPYGSYNAAVEMAAWRAGYASAFQVGDFVEMTTNEKFALGRLQIDEYTSVDLGKSGWYEFFVNRIEETSVTIPYISTVSTRFLDPVTHAALNTSQIRPGQSILVHVDVNNAGSPAPVIASLVLDSDTNHSSVVYDSHTAGQDRAVVCPWGASSYEWTWTVPSNATAGQYFYASVAFLDPKYVLTFKGTGWQTAFSIAASGQMAAASSTSPTTAASKSATSAPTANVVTAPPAAKTQTAVASAAPASTTLTTQPISLAKATSAADAATAHGIALLEVLKSWRRIL